MRVDVSDSHIALAIAKALTSLSDDLVAELVFRAKRNDIAKRHGRFWRSRSWDDPDQVSSAADVVQAALSRDRNVIGIFERGVDLRKFLSENDEELFGLLDAVHARLAINSAVTLALYFLSLHEDRLEVPAADAPSEDDELPF